MRSNDPWFVAIVERLRKDKEQAEKAITQLTFDELKRRPAPTFNSVATIMRHVAGNLISRWTDFLTTDGDKPTRNRESEFADWTGTRDELTAHWERGYATMFASLEALTDQDMKKSVTIRAEPHTVPQAVVRTLQHTAYHVGQILLVSRLVHSGEWRFITIAPGGSDKFNREMKRGSPERP